MRPDVPRPLALLLGVVALFGTAWALMTPIFQAPDEIAHFAYVQTVAELGQLPGDSSLPRYSQEMNEANSHTNVQATIFWPYAHPEWSAAREKGVDAVAGTWNRDDTGGDSPAWAYPPFYYGYESVAYLASSKANIFTRFDILRLASMLWLLVNTVGAWLLAGELFARRRPQVVAAGTIGLWPMISYITASVNPDAALYGLCTLALWMGVKIAKRGLTPQRALALGAFAGAGMLTKAQTIALLPGVLALLAWAAWKARKSEGFRRAASALAVGVGAIAVPIVAWRLASKGGTGYSEVADLGASAAKAFNVREFISYLWQFYLPRLDFMTPVHHHVPVLSDRPLYNTWIGMGWGTFGWVNVWFPTGVYKFFAGITALLALLGVNAAVQWLRTSRAAWRRELPAAIFLAGSVGMTLAAIHWTDYRFYINGNGLFAQARYLFPVAAVGAVVVAWAFEALPRRLRAPAGAIWLTGLVVLQLAALGLITQRWYA